MMHHKAISTAACLLAFILTGCSTNDLRVLSTSTRTPEDARGGVVAPAPDTMHVVWHGRDIGDFQEKYDLAVDLTASRIIYKQAATSKWPAKGINGVKVVGNFWVIMEIEGELHGFTHEWARPGQQIKNKSSVAGDHIKHALVPRDWKPAPGQVLWFCVSGLARGGLSNVPERTKLVRVVWK